MSAQETKDTPRTAGCCDYEDPSMLWASYRSAHNRKEMEVAQERLNTYIRVWVEQGAGSVTPSPMISAKSDRFGLLKPCIAFDLPEKAWLLSNRPSGLVTALEEHVTMLSRQLVSVLGRASESPRVRRNRHSGSPGAHSNSSRRLTDSNSSKSSQGSGTCPLPSVELPQLLQDAAHISTLLARVGGCAENYGELRKSNLVPPVIVYLQCLLNMVKCISKEHFSLLLHSLNHSVAFLHVMLDPRRQWQQRFMSLHTLSDPTLSNFIQVPSLLLGVFIDAFHNKLSVTEEQKEAWSDFQFGLLHLLGAMLCSSNENACTAASQDVSLLLLALLDPRDKCTAIQVLATKVLVKLVHVLHNTVAMETQTTVDSGVMLVGFLNVLSPRFHADGLTPPCIKMVITMIDIIPSLMSPPGNVAQLRQIFVDVGCYEKICEVLTLVQDEAQQSPEDAGVLVCQVFSSFSSVMANSESLRSGFEQRVGHTKLAQLVSLVTPPTKDILQAALDMVVEEKYTFNEDTHSIYNTPAVAMLIRWLLSLNSDLCKWLSDRLFDMCSFGAHNKQRCCTAGLVTVITEVLAVSQEGQTFTEEVEENLIGLVEVLGTHSIRAVELKQLIGLLRPLECQLPTYYYRLHKALTVMAHRLGKEGIAPLHYFDLRTPGSCIIIPDLRHFPNSTSLTFHTWVSLDHPRVNSGQLLSCRDVFSSVKQPSHKRRVLYSFYTSSGAGFEAFFTNSLVLTVATVTKKEFITLSLKECPLTSLEWHSVSVVYHLSKRPWGKSDVCVYIDGELRRVANMKTPSFSDVYTSSCIGFAPSIGGDRSPSIRHVFPTPPSPSFSHSSSSGSFDIDVIPAPTLTSVPLGGVVKDWGHVTNLHGLISSLCIFGDALSANSIKILHKRGPNDLSLFQPKCSETQDMANKLFVYYHAKAVQGKVCVDLSPCHVAHKTFYGEFNGQHYLTWDVKAVLGSLGGVELLYPILEQVHLSVRKRLCNHSNQPDEMKTEQTGSHGNSDECCIGLQVPVTTQNKSPGWWFGEKEGVASFIKLLLSMLKGSPINQQVFFLSEGPATIGALLQKITPSRITVQALSAVQELVEHFTDVEEHRCFMYRYLLFDFRIWSRPDFSVRSGHTQYISTIVKDHTLECRRNFGVQYLLDVIRIFYSTMGSKVQSSFSECLELTDEEQQSIRAALLSNIKLYVLQDILWDEVDSIMSFLAAASDPNLQEEILRLIYNLLKSGQCQYILGELLWEKGIPLLVLIRAQSMSVRLLAIKIVSHLNGQHGYSETGPIHSALRDGSLAAAIGHMTEHEMSSSIILALLELCVAKNNVNCTDYISNFTIYLSVLQLLRRAPLMVRHTICQQVLSMLFHTPSHVTDITSSHGWESLFLWLLTPFDPNQDGNGTTEKEMEFPQVILESDIESELPNGSPVTYRTLNSFKDASTSGDSVSVDGVSGDSGDGVEATKDDVSLSDELFPIPVVTTDPVESGGTLQLTDVTIRPKSNSHLTTPPTQRPVSMPMNSDLTLAVQDDDSRMRRRSTAFVDPTTQGERDISVTKDKVIDKALANRKSFAKKRQSLTYATSWSDLIDNDSEEVRRTFSVVTETISYILWHTVDYDTGNPPWKVWGKFFSALDLFSKEQCLVVPAHTIKQRIFLLLIHAVTMDTKDQGVDHSALLDVILQLSQLVETFTMTTYPHMHTKEDHDVLLLKLAHNFVPDIDVKHCSVELLEKYLLMLTTAKLFDSSMSGAGLQLEIVQSAVRVLLSCVANENKDYYVAACLKLEHLLRAPSLPKADVYFILSNLVRIMSESIEGGDHERSEYISAVVRKVFSQHSSHMELSDQIPSLPSPENPTFSRDFVVYSESKEWKEYMSGVIKTQEALYNTVLLPWLHTLSNHDLICRQLAEQEELERRNASRTHQGKYSEISERMYSLHESERRRQRSADVQQRNELSVTIQRWKGSRRFFTGERGAWSARREDPYLWKLDRAENFSRMRIRLARNYNFDTHFEASHLRDLANTPDSLLNNLTAGSELLAKVVRRRSSVSSTMTFDDEDYLLDQAWSDANALGAREEGVGDETTNSEKENTVKSVQCSLIMLMDKVPGTLEITTKHVYFSCDNQEKRDSQSWYSTDFKVPLVQLREIHSRRYNMARTALEIFLVDQTNYFLNFPDKKTVQKVRTAILSLRPPNLNRAALRRPSRLLQASGLTQKWIKREISNFDYLMQLNTIAGRTYNDLNQYPIFPWILVDYESETLDLSDPKIFRDLSKPVGIQNPRSEEKLRERYDEVDDPAMGKFHFGSHYSNAAGVMHYLIRLEPFTTLHIELQSGKFDYADRQFFSIPSTWKVIYTSGTDVKELIPEFFYLPEFLKNLNKFDLGKLQTGLVLGDVILPRWASSPEDFIRKHREALECDYVSANLHNWIDLIFGYKQTGPEAEKACNVFNYYCYEENVNLESIKDPRERRQIESIINNFGQTPTQLFTEPHTPRMSVEVARRNQAKGFTAFIGRKNVISLFDHLPTLKAHSVDISESHSVAFVGVPSIQTRALLISGNPEQLVTVTNAGLLNVHGWLAFSHSKTRPFTFQFDPNQHFDHTKWQYLGGPYAQDLQINQHLFVLSPNNKLLATAGHWDNSFRVHSVEKGKLIARLTHHNDIVTCLALDKAGSGDHLVTGSRDTTCAIWKFSSNHNDISTHPLQTLYGHDSEILCADISTELDLTISGAKDGTCLIHTVRQGRYVQTLRPREDRRCEIHYVSISSHGRLVVYTEDRSMRQRAISAVPPCVHLYTINGHLLVEKELSECMNAVVVTDKYLITGNTRGFITFRDLFSLQQLNSLNLLAPIHCIDVVQDHSTKVFTHLLVGLQNGKLIIVSGKDLPQ